MQTVTWLFDFVGPEGVADSSEAPSPARKLLATAVATLLALAAASLWGVVVGAHGHLSLSNVLTVPMLVAASATAALPLVLFVVKLTTSRLKASDLLFAYSSAAFSGCTALLLLAPLVAIFQQSSSLVGAAVAPLSAGVAFVVAASVFLRLLVRLQGGRLSFRAFVLPVALLVVLQGAAIVQLASLSHPLFGQRTTLGHGIDALAPQTSGEPAQ